MRRKTQSIIEYVMVVAIAAAVASAMVVYIQNAMNFKFSQVRQELNESQRSNK